MAKVNVRTEELDVVGDVFGILIENDMAYLYSLVGFDGYWKYQLTFHSSNLADLEKVAKLAKR